MPQKVSLPKRSYEQINRDRRRLLDLGYEAFPDNVFPLHDPKFPIKFDWDSDDGRAALFDIFYLHESGLVRADKQGAFGEPDNVVCYVLTAEGINLVETPGHLDTRFPVVSISHTQGNVIIGDHNVSVQNDIKALERLLQTIEKMEAKPEEKTDITKRIKELLAHPLLQTLLSLGGSLGKGIFK